MTGRRVALLVALLCGCCALALATYLDDPAPGPAGTLAVLAAQPELAVQPTPPEPLFAFTDAVAAEPPPEDPTTTTQAPPPPTTTAAPEPPTTTTTEPPTTTTAAPEPEPTTPRRPQPEAADPAPETTTTTTEAPAPPVTEAAPVYQGPSMGDGWALLRRCESGGDYAINTGNGFYGAYQFNQATWDGAVARAGYPEWAGSRASSAPPAVQDAAALQLYSERGAQPWPECGRYL